jgi:hypothetical protein
MLYRAGKRAGAKLLGLSGLGFFVLAVCGTASAFLSRVGVCQLLVPALLYAALPAAVTLAAVLEGLRRWSGTVTSPLLVLAALPVLVWIGVPSEAVDWGQRLCRTEPLEIGLGSQREALVEAVQENTNDQARILWEDRRGPRHASRWPALLPVLTGRAFVGGLDSEAGIEHATSGLVDHRLAGRPVQDCSDAELDDYCRRYNIGWVVCWSDVSRERFSRWSSAGAAKSIPISASEDVMLIPVRRKPSFALTGSVRWRSADNRRILLADLVPAVADGTRQVVLSLHYQAGMRVSPSRVRLEPAMDSHDTIPFVRLRMSEPVGRIMITWDSR